MHVNKPVGHEWLSALRDCIARVEQSEPADGFWFDAAQASLIRALKVQEAHCRAFVEEERETLNGAARERVA